jgi:hypothetical protein
VDEHKYALIIKLAVLIRLDPVVLPRGKEGAGTLCHTGQSPCRFGRSNESDYVELDLRIRPI